MTDQLDAIVVGANVVGLFTALELLHRGLKVRIVDKDFHGPIRTHVGEMAPLGGDKEMDAKTVTVEGRDKGKQDAVPVTNFVTQMIEEIKARS